MGEPDQQQPRQQGDQVPGQARTDQQRQRGHRAALQPRGQDQIEQIPRPRIGLEQIQQPGLQRVGDGTQGLEAAGCTPVFRRGRDRGRDRAGRRAADTAKAIHRRQLQDRLGINDAGGDPPFHDHVTGQLWIRTGSHRQGRSGCDA
jgi:hypothetical protein